MSIQTERIGAAFPDTDTLDGSIPSNAGELLAWLDEQSGIIETENGHIHVPSGYETTGRKSYSSQRDVVDAWEAMKFPAHNIVEYDGRQAAELYTLSSYTDEFEGPTIRVPMWTMGGQVQQPGAAYVCNECGYQTRVFDPNRTSSRRQSREESRIESHIEEEHDGLGQYRRIRGHERTESVKNFRALQFPDGSGLVEHYDTIESVRTRSGVVLTNRQCFSKGNAHCSFASESDMKLPLNGIQAMLEEDETLFDITDVFADEVSIWIRGNYNRETGETDYSDADVRQGGVPKDRARVAVLENGHAIAVVYDETASDRHERKVGFRLEPDEVQALRQADDVYDLLKPNIVAAYEKNGYDVVTAAEFQGGPGNSPFYNENLLGDVIVRQGEWYFVPMDEDFSPDTPVYHTYKRGGWDVSHIDGTSTVDPLPTECHECGETAFDVGYREAVCKGCGHVHVKESTTSLPEDEQPFDPTIMGNHTVREVTVDDEGDIYVRGSVRHAESEHRMINLGDRWHLAAKNTKDGVVFDTSTPDSTSGRSTETFGVARVD